MRNVFLFLFLFLSLAHAEEVDVKYRGKLDLKPFECSDHARSSLVKRLCYDKKNSYVIVLLNKTYYHYCEMPEAALAAWKAADSMGRYYNANIKGSGSDGPYDCRTRKVPTYW